MLYDLIHVMKGNFDFKYRLTLDPVQHEQSIEFSPGPINALQPNIK